MEQIYEVGKENVSIIKVFVKGRTNEVKNNINGYAIDIECCDVFLTDFIKNQLESLCALVLSYAPELQLYRHIKDNTQIMEFKATQFLSGMYKVTVSNEFDQFLKKMDAYNNTINIISKSIIERINYLFSAYSINNY